MLTISRDELLRKIDGQICLIFNDFHLCLPCALQYFSNIYLQLHHLPTMLNSRRTGLTVSQECRERQNSNLTHRYGQPSTVRSLLHAVWTHSFYFCDRCPAWVKGNYDMDVRGVVHMSCENLQLKGNMTGSHAQPQPEITWLEVWDPVLKEELAGQDVWVRACACVCACARTHVLCAVYAMFFTYKNMNKNFVALQP